MESGTGTDRGFSTSRKTAPILLWALLSCLAAGSTPTPPGEVSRAAGPETGTPSEDDAGVTAGERRDWWGRAERSIRDSEYDVTWQETTSLKDLSRAWQAPNRAHGFRSYFTDTGIRVIPRAEGKPAWEWGLSLIGYGRSDRLAAVAAATLHPAGSRIEYRRDGILEEYVNDRRGIEQQFTLAVPPEAFAPSGGGAGERGALPGGRGFLSEEREDPAFLVLALGGTLSGMPTGDGRGIDFTARGGARVLRYAALEVRDAAGRELPARMEAFVDGEIRGVRLTYEDRDAVYPVLVDPLATSPSWTAESDQAGAQAGFSVFTAGDVNGDGFSDVLVGAPFYDNGQTDEGRAFVYPGSASGPSAAPAWTAESDQDSAQFGRSLATAGDVNGDGFSDVIVGSPAYDNGQVDEGRAFVYHGSATGLAAAPSWTAEANQAGALCGSSVGSAGDANGDGYADVIAGAPSYNNAHFDQGRAWVFNGSPSGLASSPSWMGEINAAGAGFGIAVSTGGDMNGDGYSEVIVGASLYSNPEAEEGGIWIFNGSSTGLSPYFASWDQGDQAGAHMGASVAAAGDYDGDGYADAVFGVPGYSSGQAGEGAIGSIRGGAGGYAAAQLSFQTDQAGARFGASVSAAGDVNGDGYADVVVGAPGYDNGQTDEGRAYLFPGAGGGLFMGPSWTLESNQAGAGLGLSVATAGDVNGDGYSDVIVGTPSFDNGQVDVGQAQVHLGSADGLAGAWHAEINAVGVQLGASVAMAGDVNGDGYTDVLVGAPLYDNGQTDEGRVFLFHGSVSGPDVSSPWRAEGDQASASFGSSLGTAGDVNGDGYSDVIIGAPLYDCGQTNEGKAFVYHGSAAGLGTSPAWTAEGNLASAQLGLSVSTAGDVNGDGFSDVIVGAPYYDNGQTDEGRAFLHSGSASGLSASPAWTAECNQATAYFGFSVMTAGDVNADGFSDLIIGAYTFDNGQTNEGRAYVYHGSATIPPAGPSWTAEGNQASAWFGYSVSTAGDVNGDGYSDVVIGAPYYDNGATDEGMAFLFYGSASGLAGVKGWTEEGEQSGAHLGWVVCSAGDVNGDGYSDLCAGGNQYDAPGLADAGIATVNYGSATGPRVDVWDFASTGDQATARMGAAIAGGGDVDGDGYGDLLVGAPLYDNGQTDEGRLYFVNGNGWFHDLSNTLQQRRADGSAPIDHLGASESCNSFRISQRVRSVFGRSRIRLEWEAKPLGILFDGAGSQRSAAWIDTGAEGAPVSEPVTGLSADTVYHWRARVRYDPAVTPFQPAGPWRAPPWNGWQEADLRTATIVDGDGDGHFSDTDCDDGAPGIWATPGEVGGLALGAGGAMLSWGPPADPGGMPSALVYDALRSGSPADFNAAMCLESNDGSDTAAQDPATPAPGALFAYLVRAGNACPDGEGTLGNQSNGTPRVGAACP